MRQENEKDKFMGCRGRIVREIARCGMRYQVIVDFMEMNAEYDEKEALKAMYEDRDVRSEKWPDVAMNGISIKTQSQKKESVSVARLATRLSMLCRRSK